MSDKENGTGGEKTMSPQPCEQEANIINILDRVEQNRQIQEQNTQRIEQSVSLLVQKQEKFLDKMEQVLIEDRDMKKDIEQMKKDVDHLGDKIRTVKEDVDSCKSTRDQMTGMGLMERFPKVWDWHQQEKGWRRFVPTAMALVSTALAIILSISKLVE